MKNAFVMGASSGIGLETARVLLEKGWIVCVAARREEPLEKLQKEYPNHVFIAKIDVTHPDACSLLLDGIEQMGGMNLYLHVAGVGWQNPELNAEHEMATIETNGMGFTRLVGCAFRYLAEHGGHIAVISSIAGTKGLGQAPAYSATKAFQNTYIQALEQLAHQRHLPITFTDIRPGFVDTPLIENSNFPLKLNARYVAKKIVKAIEHRRHVAVIDERYRILVFFWKLIPNFLWRNMNIS